MTRTRPLPTLAALAATSVLLVAACTGDAGGGMDCGCDVPPTETTETTQTTVVPRVGT